MARGSGGGGGNVRLQRAQTSDFFCFESGSACLINSCLDAGFFLACEDFGRMFDHSFPACTFFF